MNETLLWLIPALPLAAFLLNGLLGRWLKELGGWLAFGAMAGSAAISIWLLIAAAQAPHAEHGASAAHGSAVEVTDEAGLAAGEEPHAEAAAELEPEHDIAAPADVEAATATPAHPEAGAAGEGEGLHLPLHPEPLWEWISVGSFSVSIGFLFDHLTAVMCFIVTFVGSLVFLYSIGYMHGDKGFSRFFAYLSLFAFSMLILVLADNLLLLFVGWEGVGLCSYLLIGYYLNLEGAPDAGKKAFIVNRVGDFGFLLAMFMIWQYTGTLNLPELVRHASEYGTFEYGGVAITTITLLMFLGCTGKSAQIPLFVWLPDAMAGPTPVSALIHAATMVTAGVYLLVRTSALFALAPATMVTIAAIGAATAFVAGTIAITQRDIKKVLAYSTVSQLGFMFLACGVGAFAAGIFHVLTHAFFKACLFLGAGAVIHAAGGTQDLFEMGGLRKKLPVTAITFLISSLAIAGFPLTAGFWSKDEILWMSFAAAPTALTPFRFPVLWIVGVITALMTAIYMFRAYFLAFEGETRLPEKVLHHLHLPGWTMKLPLIVLAAGAIVAGYVNVPHAFSPFFGLGEGAHLHHWLYPVTGAAETTLAANPMHAGEVPGVALERFFALISIAIALLGIWIAYVYCLKGWPKRSEALARRLGPIHSLSANRWWWDEVYNVVFAGGVRVIGAVAVWFDRIIIDGILHGVAATARGGAAFIRSLQFGQVQAYALIMLIGVIILLQVILLTR